MADRSCGALGVNMTKYKPIAVLSDSHRLAKAIAERRGMKLRSIVESLIALEARKLRIK